MGCSYVAYLISDWYAAVYSREPFECIQDSGVVDAKEMRAVFMMSIGGGAVWTSMCSEPPTYTVLAVTLMAYEDAGVRPAGYNNGIFFK